MIGEWLAFKSWELDRLPSGCEYCPTATMADGRHWGKCPFTGEEWPDEIARGKQCPMVVVIGTVLEEDGDK